MTIKSILFGICIVFVTCGFASAESQVITLKDGSQIKGELAGVADGVYTVKTPLLGDVHINSNQVISISVENAASPVPVPTPPPLGNQPHMENMDQKITAAQNQLMANPEFLSEIQTFAQDPEITQLISDPQLMQKIMSKDVAAIQSDPKAQALMNNPKMKALIEKLRGNTSN